MKIKKVYPKTNEVFGKLEFAGETDGIFDWNNKTRQRVQTHRKFNLYSEKIRTDDIVVTIPVSSGVKRISPDTHVELVDAYITAHAKTSGDVSYTDYQLHAENMTIAG